MISWFHAGNAADIPTPALLIYPDRIAENIRRMVKIAGSADKLRPHVKTHKMSEVIRLHQESGIQKFKCSTIAEAEMIAGCNARDIVLAMQPVGIQISRFFNLAEHYPDIRFSAIADSQRVVEDIARQASQKACIIDLWIDINNGMDRTGITPGLALQLYREIAASPFLKIRGLHVYDGHIHERELPDRKIRCENDFKPVLSLIGEIVRAGWDAPVIIAGGTPTFPIHSGRENTELSPGTCVLWDSGYASNFPDLDFLQAAVVLTRVVSKPGRNLLCLDLGHKALAAEMPHPRVSLLDVQVSRFVNHSEEHLVIETPDAEKYTPGDLIYGVPWHICPTVPRYHAAYVVTGGNISGEWKIDARDRMITF
jgi:D-serine deaminase-like pyridoxal phosphate-dependent protein